MPAETEGCFSEHRHGGQFLLCPLQTGPFRSGGHRFAGPDACGGERMTVRAPSGLAKSGANWSIVRTAPEGREENPADVSPDLALRSDLAGALPMTAALGVPRPGPASLSIQLKFITDG